MGKINRLSEHLSNMIAAGEVVERPMGIVKELVENSIDAHASNIEIQISQGGIDAITIIDDGDGMDAQDATLAFERHATSKLKDVDDLWNIHTMGFRGEALPSIASVSHVRMRTNNGKDATEVEIHYGTLTCARPCASPKGTMIEVKNLFQKTPARFKHLKSPQYEFSLISDVIQKFALSHPEIGFQLSHDGRGIFRTRGNGSLLEVLMQIYGRETAKSAILLEANDEDYRLQGYLMQPQFNRATKYYMLLYINGRMIRSYHLQKAIMDAYAPYLPKERYPIAVINVQMDAHLVDVNVHPSKWEIRLSKEKQLEKLLYHSIGEALKKRLEVVNIHGERQKKTEKVEMPALEFTYARDQRLKQLHEDVNRSFVQPPQEQASIAPVPDKKVTIITDTTEAETAASAIPSQIQEEAATYTTTPAAEAAPSFAFKPQDHSERLEIKPAASQSSAQALSQDDHAVKENAPVLSKEITPTVKNPSLPQLRVIGQFRNCYIIAEGESGLYIIDQHAAQERYHYEVIRKQILTGVKDTQPLLLPLTIESSMAAVAQADVLNERLAPLGIHLEVFGSSTFICRELPVWMKQVEEIAFLRDMIDIWEKDKEVSLEKLRKHAIATMACHSSIRFHRSLTMEEMRQVMDDLGKCEQPFHCPHGRPTMIQLKDKELIHMFERG